MGTKHAHIITNSLDGCVVEIDGDVVYGLMPPRITGFRGLVHISGGPPGSPNRDLYFGVEPKSKSKDVADLTADETKP